MNKNAKKTLDFVLIIIVFSLAGSSTAFLSGIIMHALGAEPWTFGYVIGYIAFIFPLYQGLTLVYAFIVGKFNWFYSRQKRIARKIASLFTGKKKDSSPASESK